MDTTRVNPAVTTFLRWCYFAKSFDFVKSFLMRQVCWWEYIFKRNLVLVGPLPVGKDSVLILFKMELRVGDLLKLQGMRIQKTHFGVFDDGNRKDPLGVRFSWWVKFSITVRLRGSDERIRKSSHSDTLALYPHLEQTTTGAKMYSWWVSNWLWSHCCEGVQSWNSFTLNGIQRYLE